MAQTHIKGVHVSGHDKEGKTISEDVFTCNWCGSKTLAEELTAFGDNYHVCNSCVKKLAGAIENGQPRTKGQRLAPTP